MDNDCKHNEGFHYIPWRREMCCLLCGESSEQIEIARLRAALAVAERERDLLQTALNYWTYKMGTNYYLHDREPCPCCERSFPSKHIGKSSFGWCFGLHVIPEDGINTLDDWRHEWSKDGVHIENEYGERISIETMEEIITNRSHKVDWPPWDKEMNGYESEHAFHVANYSERGPNGLLRHRIDNYHCIGHGEGTWDYVKGEFS